MTASEADVALLAALARLELPADGAPAVAAVLREALETARAMETQDGLETAVPALSFDPRWS